MMKPRQGPHPLWKTPDGYAANPLHAMQGRLDADRQPGRSADDLPVGSRTGALGHDQLRSLRAEGGSDLAGPSGDGGAVAVDFSAELGAVGAYFAARMAAARRALRPGDVAVALRALQNERTLAMRAVIDKWMTAARDAAYRRVLAKPTRPAGSQRPSRRLPRLNRNVSRDGWIGASTAVPRPPNRRTSAKLFLS